MKDKNKTHPRVRFVLECSRGHYFFFAVFFATFLATFFAGAFFATFLATFLAGAFFTTFFATFLAGAFFATFFFVDMNENYNFYSQILDRIIPF